MHPNCQGLFLFDQSSNHSALPEDALRASTMNLGKGGKAPKMRDGWFYRDGVKVVQAMQGGDGIPKGVQQVLAERGLWRNGLRLTCKSCLDGSLSCCARKIMANQPDFLEQRSNLTITVEAAGHLADFYPKYHCETNFIERVWGEAKRIARKDCLFNFAKMAEQVPDIIRNVPLEHIRRYHRRAWRYIDAYSKDLTGRMAEWAVQKYKGHRKVSITLDKVVEEMNKELM